MTYQELSEILSERKMTMMEFSRQTGVAPQILTNAKKRGGHFSAATMAKMDSFLSENNNQDIVLNIDERKLIEEYRTADDETQRMIIEMIAFLKKKKAEN